MALARGVRSMRARLGIVAATVAAVLVLGFAALHTPPVRRFALRLALSRLEHAGLAARADSLDYNLAARSFHVANLTLAPSASASEPFFSARDVRVTLAPSILFGRIALEDVAVDEPRVTIVAAPAAAPGTRAPDRSGFPSIPIEHARVTNLGFSWRDAQSSIDVGASFDLSSDGHTARGSIVSTRPGRIAWRDQRTTIDAIDGRVSWNGRDAGLEGLRLRLPEGTMTADGRVDAVTSAPRIDVRVTADANLAALAPWLAIDRAVSGAAHAEVKVTGPLSRPGVTFALSGRNVVVAGLPAANFSAEGQTADRLIRLTSFRGEIVRGSLTANGQVTLDGAGSFRASWQGLDLASAVRGLSNGAHPSIMPAATLSGSAEARWSAPRLDALALNAEVAASPDAARASGTLPFDGSLKASLRALAWELSTGDFGTSGARVAGRAGGAIDSQRLSDSTLAGSLHVDANDAAQLARTLARAGVMTTPPAIEGRASGDFAVSGSLGAPSAGGPLRATLRYAALPAADVTAIATITSDGARADGIDVRAGTSSVSGAVRWAKGSDAVGGAIDASIAVADIAGLLTADPDRLRPDGRLAASASLSGTLAHADAAITGNGTALEIAGEHVDATSFDVRADFTGPRFVVDRLTLQSGAGRADGRGDVDFARGTYTVHLAATDVPLRPLAGAGETALPVSARVSGSFDGEGSFANLGGGGHVTLTGTRWNDLDLGPLTADLTLDRRTASVSAAAAELALAASGSFGVDPPGAIAVKGTWTPGDVAPIARRLGLSASMPVNGPANVSFDVNGTRERPNDLRATATLEALDLTAAGQRIRLTRPGRIEYDGRTARAVNVALGFGASTLTIDGEAGDQAARELVASLDGSLADFAFLRDLLHGGSGASQPLPAPAGAVQARLAVNGPPARPAVTGTVQISGGRVPVGAGQDVSAIELRGRLEGGVLTLDSAAAEFQGAVLSASARIPSETIADRLPPWLRQRVTPAAGPATLSARLQSVTPAVASSFLDAQTLAQIAGRMDATIQLEANRLALDRVRGTLTVDRSDLVLGGVALAQQVPTRLALQNGRLTVQAWDWGRDDNRLAVRGGATLAAPTSLDLVATSVLDLRTLDIFAQPARFTGRADAEVRVGGTVDRPRLDGWVTFSNGEVRVPNPRLVATDITGTVTLASDTVTFERLFASVNGGDSEIAGTLRHDGFTPQGGRVTLTTNGAALDVAGLRAEANLNLALEAEPGRPVVNGTVTLVRSAYREPLSLTSGLLRALQSPAESPRPAGPSPLDTLRLDVRIATQNDLIVDNNYGKLSANVDVRLVGTATRPSITGRTTLGEGGSIFFNTRRYRLDEGGTIDFTNATRVEPDLNLKARTSVQNTDITLSITGTPSTLQTALRSDDHPEYTQSDLVSLLLVGRTSGEAATASASANGAQLLGLLSGEFLGTAGQALGLSTLRVESGTPDVRFDAGLVAPETDPGARLTIGRNIGSRVEVVFSQSLQQSNGLTWIVSYAPKSNLNVRVVNFDSGDRVYDFRHDLTFGRPASDVRAAPRPRETVARVAISGAGPDTDAVRSRLSLAEGDRFSFFRWQDDRERIETYFHDRDRFEARVVTRRTVDASDATRISLNYDISPGPRTLVDIRGFELSSSAQREIKRAWAGAVVDDLLREEVVRIARGALADEGYVAATVTAQLRSSPGERTLTVAVEAGVRADRREVRFSGNQHQPEKRLLAVLAAPSPQGGLARAIWLEPERVQDALVAFYQANGYLNAAVHVDPVSRDGGTVIRPIRVDEGEPFRVHAIRVDGAHALSPPDVLAKAGLARGDVITEAGMDRARGALDQSYRSRGFNSVAIVLQSVVAADRTGVDLVVRVDEGRQQRLGDVVTTGIEHTSPALVSRALKLDVGAPVDLSAWNEARRRLYETGAFRSVDIEREVISETPNEPAAPDSSAAEPVRALVTVQEWPRFRFRYGLEVNDTAQSGSEDPSEIGPTLQAGGRTFSLGATTDFAARNLFGRAVTAGVAGRYTVDFRAARTYATMPTLFGRRITSTVFLEQSHEGVGTTITGEHPRLGVDVTTFTFEQRIRPRPKVEVQYGYSFERNRTQELHHTDPTTPTFDATVTKGSLTSSVVLDRRDDLFDATTGWFHATNATYAPEWLSSTRLARILVQQRYYRRLGPVVFASWGQVGLATAFDQITLPIDRFFAGGGNSVRGYAEEALSPRDFLGDIVGGNALIVLNQEIRFPLFPYVRGVGFIDAGRAFESVGQMSLSDLSAGTGIGFRVQTPVVLLRFDVGVPLDASVGPRRPRWFFSIGQMF